MARILMAMSNHPVTITVVALFWISLSVAGAGMLILSTFRNTIKMSLSLSLSLRERNARRPITIVQLPLLCRRQRSIFLLPPRWDGSAGRKPVMLPVLLLSKREFVLVDAHHMFFFFFFPFFVFSFDGFAIEQQERESSTSCNKKDFYLLEIFVESWAEYSCCSCVCTHHHHKFQRPYSLDKSC